jgi:hypothetical protein
MQFATDLGYVRHETVAVKVVKMIILRTYSNSLLLRSSLFQKTDSFTRIHTEVICWRVRTADCAIWTLE